MDFLVDAVHQIKHIVCRPNIGETRSCANMSDGQCIDGFAGMIARPWSWQIGHNCHIGLLYVLSAN